MNTQHNRQAESITLRLWTYSQTLKALPYLRAVVRSLRDQWLEMQRARLQVQRMDTLFGRLDRKGLIQRAEAVREVERAQDNFLETLRELRTLDVYCLNPAQGTALIPFALGDDLAWFVFDLFAEKGLTAWQYDADPPETRRPLAEDSRPAAPPRLPTAAVDFLMAQAATDQTELKKLRS